MVDEQGTRNASKPLAALESLLANLTLTMRRQCSPRSASSLSAVLIEVASFHKFAPTKTESSSCLRGVQVNCSHTR